MYGGQVILLKMCCSSVFIYWHVYPTSILLQTIPEPSRLIFQLILNILRTTWCNIPWSRLFKFKYLILPTYLRWSLDELNKIWNIEILEEYSSSRMKVGRAELEVMRDKTEVWAVRLIDQEQIKKLVSTVIIEMNLFRYWLIYSSFFHIVIILKKYL